MLNFTALISYSLITTFTPGPNNIMSMSNASRYGFKKSIPFNIGVCFGFLAIILLSGIFSATLYHIIPSVKPVMTYIGAAYILWLAWKIYRSKAKGEAKREGHTNTFLSGFFLQFVNPKGILYGITTMSTFILPYTKSIPLIAVISLMLALIAFLSTSCWSLFGAVFQRLLAKHARVINIIMALLLVYCAVSLFHN